MVRLLSCLSTRRLLALAAATCTLAGCSGAGPLSAPGANPVLAGPGTKTTLSNGAPIPATIQTTIVETAPGHRTVALTLTFGSVTINTTCVRIDANIVPPVNFPPTNLKADRLCTAISGGSGTMSLRWDGQSTSTTDPFLFDGNGDIYAGTGDFTNLRGSFSLNAVFYFFAGYPRTDTESWTGHVVYNI
jgi:hypothetical protein